MPEDLSPTMTFALDVLDYLDDAGLVCIPAEPTPEMVEAGCGIAGIDEATALEIYRAMVGSS